MTNEYIFTILEEIVSPYVEHIDQIRMDSNLIKDLGMDSIDLVDVVIGIEEKFNFSVPDKDWNRFILVSDVIQYIQEQKSNV